ncbi:MAG: hypothetical protein JO318_03915 [Chloroflexi bacterium]|nr:hypothetical protein [Chloroflexota bacterium]
MAVHQALLFRQLTADVVLFTHTMPALTAAQLAEMAARDIRIVSGAVERVEVEHDRLTGVRMENGTVVSRDVVVVGPRMVARSDVLASLGLQPVEHPLGLGTFIPADPTGLTDVPGVWVAGNVHDLSATVIGAAAAGLTAAAAINADLVASAI